MQTLDYLSIAILVIIIVFAFFATDLLFADNIKETGEIQSISINPDTEEINIIVRQDDTNKLKTVFCKSSDIVKYKTAGKQCKYFAAYGKLTKINYLNYCTY